MDGLTRNLSPGERATADQRLALIEDVERAWPYNQGVLADSVCEDVVLDRLGEAWVGMRADRAYLLWGNGRLVPVEPDALLIGAAVQSTMPDQATSECDRCHRVGVVGAAAVACPRNVVPLLLCTNCADQVEPDLLTTGVC
jgi:hypothetical protein